MADSIAEMFSRSLSREYQKKFGRENVLHHNVDKLDVVGGEVTTKFGGGKVRRPILVFFSGRATYRVNRREIGRDGKRWLSDLAIRSAREWLSKNFRYLDPKEVKHVKLSTLFVQTKGGAAELKKTVEMSQNKHTVPSNDTSLGSGYYPASPLEQVTLHLRRHLNSRQFLESNPYLGEDVKIMGIRKPNSSNRLKLTVAISFVDGKVSGPLDYFSKKKRLEDELTTFVRNFIRANEFDLFLEENALKINTLDDEELALRTRERPEEHCYLTVLGTSAEHGDDGAVGRGNRVNGINTYDKPVSMEAAAGKNPISHVGKLYNVMAFLVAKRIYDEKVAPFKEVFVRFVSQIGQPTNEPQLASFQYVTDDELTAEQVSEVRRIVQNELDHRLLRRVGNIPLLAEEILRGDYDQGPLLYLLERSPE